MAAVARCMQIVRNAGCSAMRATLLATPSTGASGFGAAMRQCPVHPIVPLGARCVSLGIEIVETPQYANVPVVQESPETILAEMPELVLSGQSSPKGSAKTNPYAELEMGAPITVDTPPATTTVTASSVTPPQTCFAKLTNGVRVVSVERHGLCSSLGLFVHTGSRYEKADMACIPHALELMAFRSTAHLSHMRTLKTMEQLGAAASCRVGREDILYQFDVLREYVPIALPLMLANVLCPSMLPEEVEAARESVIDVQHNLKENTEGFLCEMMHVTAYHGSTLGNPLYANETDFPKITVESLRAYIERECTPDRMIVVGINVGFDDLCKWTARSFAQYAETSRMASLSTRHPEPAVYTGGEIRIQEPNPLCHFMLGWEVEGGWNGKTLAAVTVLQMFLGGGGSFSTGGPGKGMHTRLYTEVLNRHHWVESCMATSVMYADSGVFSIYATLVPQHAKDFLLVLKRIFQGLNRISAEELQRAKNALKSSIHMNLEMRSVMMEDIGRQLILSDKVGNAQEFGRMIDAVTTHDLCDALRECLKTKITVLAYGAIENVPDYATIEEHMKNAAPM